VTLADISGGPCCAAFNDTFVLTNDPFSIGQYCDYGYVLPTPPCLNYDTWILASYQPTSISVLISWGYSTHIYISFSKSGFSAPYDCDLNALDVPWSWEENAPCTGRNGTCTITSL
jgi:hypothetical protein